jgi:hypothetical protein
LQSNNDKIKGKIWLIDKKEAHEKSDRSTTQFFFSSPLTKGQEGKMSLCMIFWGVRGGALQRGSPVVKNRLRGASSAKVSSGSLKCFPYPQPSPLKD